MQHGHVELGGLRLAVQVDGRHAGELAAWHFGRLPGWEPTRGSADITIAIGLASRPPPSTLVSPRRIAHMMCEISAQGVRAEHDGGASVEATASHIQVTLWSTPEQRWWCVRQLLFLALSWVFAQHGRALLHAATIARGDHSVLVMGDTGSGKSTFAAAALVDGLQVHGDDLVVIQRDPGGDLVAHGLPKRLSFPDLATMDAVQTEELVPGDPRQRRFLALDLLEHGPLAIGALVVAGHDDGPGRLTTLSSNELLEVLVQSFGLADEPDVLRPMFPLLVSLSSKPGFAGLHSNDAGTRVKVAGGLLNQAFATIDAAE